MRELFDELGGAEEIVDKIKAAGYKPPPVMTVRGWAYRKSIPSKWLPVVLMVALDERIILDISQLSA